MPAVGRWLLEFWFPESHCRFFRTRGGCFSGRCGMQDGDHTRPPVPGSATMKYCTHCHMLDTESPPVDCFQLHLQHTVFLVFPSQTAGLLASRNVGWNFHTVSVCCVATWALDFQWLSGCGLHLLNKLCGGGWKIFCIEIRSSASYPFQNVGIFFVGEKRLFC